MLSAPYRALLAIAIALGLSACASTGLDRSSESVASDDTDKLQWRAAQLDAEIRNKGLVWQHTEVQRYIERIGHSLVPRQHRHSFHFYVLREPVVNAFALPNGSIYISLGLLARLENEAQLAHVLGHEIAHVLQAHSVKSLRSKKNRMVSSHIADLMLFGTSIAYQPFVASMAHHSRAQELEADRLALQYLSQQGYRLQDSAHLFAIIQQVKAPESVQGSIYSSHPSNIARARATRNYLAYSDIELNTDGKVRQQHYRSIRNEVIIEQLRLSLQARHYQLSLDTIAQALPTSTTPLALWYYRGEAYRLMATRPKAAAQEYAWIHGKTLSPSLVQRFYGRRPQHYASALQAYQTVLDKQPDYALAHRGLGLVYYYRNEADAARQALGYYLAQGRDIQDAPYIKYLLHQLSAREATP